VRTALALVRGTPAVPVPPSLVDELAGAPGAGGVVAVDGPDVPAVLDGLGLRVTSMGRGPDDDPLFYAAAGAAGAWAAALVAG
jgi:hypothetical protein